MTHLDGNQIAAIDSIDKLASDVEDFQCAVRALCDAVGILSQRRSVPEAMFPDRAVAPEVEKALKPARCV